MASFPESVRPYLEVHDGQLVIELFPGVAFEPDTTRAELTELLDELAESGACIAAYHTDDELRTTYFTIVGPGGRSYGLVFDDDLDRLVAFMPLDPEARALAPRSN